MNSNYVTTVSVDPKTDEEHIKELSLLTTFEYDRVRNEKAEELGIQTNTLDKAVKEARKEARVDEFNIDPPDLWPDKVNGAEVLDQIFRATIALRNNDLL